MSGSGLLNRFARDTTASAAILLALCALPVIGTMGLGVDYFTALSNKARLDHAADAAAVAAITTAQSYIGANAVRESEPGLTNNAIAAGQAQARKVFLANGGTTTTRVTAVVTPTLQRTGQTLTATVAYTGTLATGFGMLFGVPTFGLTGSAGSSLTMGLYLDFYLALDMSGSMGIPTSTAGQQQLMAVNNDMQSAYPGGCQFACHFPGYTGYTVARNNNITLRVDSVGKAVQNLIQTANATKTLPNQYRIGIYPFINNAMQAAALSSNFATATTVAGQLGDVYLDSGLSIQATKSMGSGGTHFENLAPDLSKYVQTIGNGSGATQPKAFIFLVTDGANNNQIYNGSNFNGSQPQRPTNLNCGQAKSLGITVSILYIPYQPIYNPNPSFAGDEDGKVNAVIPYIAPDLQACASPGYFFTANTEADINAAMQAMFAQALRAARLTQ